MKHFLKTWVFSLIILLIIIIGSYLFINNDILRGDPNPRNMQKNSKLSTIWSEPEIIYSEKFLGEVSAFLFDRDGRGYMMLSDVPHPEQFSSMVQTFSYTINNNWTAPIVVSDATKDASKGRLALLDDKLLLFWPERDTSEYYRISKYAIFGNDTLSRPQMAIDSVSSFRFEVISNQRDKVFIMGKYNKYLNSSRYLYQYHKGEFTELPYPYTNHIYTSFPYFYGKDEIHVSLLCNAWLCAYTYSMDEGKTWSPKSNPEHKGKAFFPQVRICKNSYGKMRVMIWLQSSDEIFANELRYSISLDGETWSENKLINKVYGDNVMLIPDIAVDKNNHIHVVWWQGQFFQGKGIICYSFFDGNSRWSNWSEVTELFPEVNGKNSPRLCVDNNNVVHIAFLGFNPHGGDAAYHATASISTSVQNRNDNQKDNYSILEIFPNPFNTNASIKYTISHSANVEINIFNIKGQLVRALLHGAKSSGSHQINWDGLADDGRSLVSGVYFCRIEAGRETDMQKVLLLR